MNVCVILLHSTIQYITESVKEGCSSNFIIKILMHSLINSTYNLVEEIWYILLLNKCSAGQ